MPDQQDQIHDIRLKVGLLEHDIQSNNALFGRLSQSIEKIQEVNTSLLRMITLHEEKHEQHERIQSVFHQDIKELHSRITSAIRDLTDAIDKSEAKVIEMIRQCHSEKFSAGGRTTEDELSWFAAMTIGKYAKVIWAISVAVFFIGYYAAKLHIFVP